MLRLNIGPTAGQDQTIQPSGKIFDMVSIDQSWQQNRDAVHMPDPRLDHCLARAIHLESASGDFHQAGGDTNQGLGLCGHLY